MRKVRVANGTGRRWLDEHVGYTSEECLVWPFSCATPGYGTFTIDGGKKRMSAHRYMCTLVGGEPPTSEHEAAHSCGNRRCVNPAHLSWKTKGDNQLDRRKHGTHRRKYTKLTPLQAAQIRQLKGQEKSVETAARYGITESNVRLIQEGKTWPDKRKWTFLTPEQVTQIRSMSGKTDREIAVMVGATENVVRRCRTGRAYRHT